MARPDGSTIPAPILEFILEDGNAWGWARLWQLDAQGQPYLVAEDRLTVTGQALPGRRGMIPVPEGIVNVTTRARDSRLGDFLVVYDAATMRALGYRAAPNEVAGIHGERLLNGRLLPGTNPSRARSFEEFRQRREQAPPGVGSIFCFRLGPVMRRVVLGLNQQMVLIIRDYDRELELRRTSVVQPGSPYAALREMQANLANAPAVAPPAGPVVQQVGVLSAEEIEEVRKQLEAAIQQEPQEMVVAEENIEESRRWLEGNVQLSQMMAMGR